MERGNAPETLPLTIRQTTMRPAGDSGGPPTRPLCPHPQVAVYKGTGSTDDAANFECGANPVGPDVVEDCDARVNERLFGKPFVPSAPCPGC